VSEHGVRPTKFGLDLTFNLGHVIIIVGSLVGFVASNYLSDYKLNALQAEVATMRAKLDGFTILLTSAAVAEYRFKELERRVEFVERR
jgi:hypothetical protein